MLVQFQIGQCLGNAVDAGRAAEAKLVKAQGKLRVLKHSRWLLLKRPERLTEEHEPKLAELLRHNLRTVGAYLPKEDFQLLWDCRSPTQANRFIKCQRAMRSRTKTMRKAAKMVRKHRPLDLLWHHLEDSGAFSSGAVGGISNRAELAIWKAYGFRCNESYELAIYHTLADLPQPSLAYRIFGRNSALQRSSPATHATLRHRSQASSRPGLIGRPGELVL